MPFIPVPDGFMAVIEQYQGGQSFTNTLWFFSASAGTEQMEELAEYLWGLWETHLKALMWTGTTLTKVTVYDMSSSEGPVVEYTTTPVAGTGAGDPLPLQVAFVMTLKTLVRGRTGRGRIYIGGMTESQSTEGGWNPATVTACEAFLNAVLGGVGALGFYFSVCSRYFEGVPREEGLLRYVYNVDSRSTLSGTQRRRSARP